MRRKGWLVYEAEHAKKNKAFIDWFLEEAEQLEVELTFVFQHQLSFGVKNNGLFLTCEGAEADVPDFVIMRNRDALFSKQLERMAIPCFNSSHVSHICNDKARTHQYLSGCSIPMLDTYFISASEMSFNSPPLPYPFVLKSRSGRGGDEVFIVENAEQLSSMKTALPAGSFIVQPLAGLPGKDLRVYVLGDQVIGSVLRSNNNSFKANYSLGGTAEAYRLSEWEQTIVNRIIDRFDFGLVGIDFLFDEQGNLLLNEIEDVVGCRTLCLTSDINIVKLYLEFILDKLQKGGGEG
jgi:gamma-F420-2:alpha-L-glutamate ligase